MNRSRLDAVVRVRRLQERIARGAVAVSRRDVADRERRRSRAMELVDELAATTPSDAGRFVAQRRSLGAGMEAVGGADATVADAHRRVRESLGEWTTAGQRLDGVERLEDRLTTAAQYELDRRTATEIDDLTVMRWRRTPRHSTPDRPLDGAP